MIRHRVALLGTRGIRERTDDPKTNKPVGGNVEFNRETHSCGGRYPVDVESRLPARRVDKGYIKIINNHEPVRCSV